MTPSEASCLRVIGNQLRANADTLEEFSVDHFAFHPFTLLGGYPEAVRGVFGREERLHALLIGLNEAVFGKPDPHGDRHPKDAGEQPAIH